MRIGTAQYAILQTDTTPHTALLTRLSELFASVRRGAPRRGGGQRVGSDRVRPHQQRLRADSGGCIVLMYNSVTLASSQGALGNSAPYHKAHNTSDVVHLLLPPLPCVESRDIRHHFSGSILSAFPDASPPSHPGHRRPRQCCLSVLLHCRCSLLVLLDGKRRHATMGRCGELGRRRRVHVPRCALSLQDAACC